MDNKNKNKNNKTTNLKHTVDNTSQHSSLWAGAVEHINALVDNGPTTQNCVPTLGGE